MEVKVGRLWISADTSPGLSVASGVGRVMQWVVGGRRVPVRGQQGGREEYVQQEGSEEEVRKSSGGVGK